MPHDHNERHEDRAVSRPNPQSDAPVALRKAQDGTYGVTYGDHVVLTGESYAFANHVVAALRGATWPCSEAEDIARSFLKTIKVKRTRRGKRGGRRGKQ